MNILNSIIEHRVKKLPITDVLKDSFMGVGAIFGGAYGWYSSLKHCDGVLWRPSMGIVSGGALGFTVGLFPFHSFGLLLMGDVAYTVSKKKVGRSDVSH
jgi:hypothetical protein